MTTTFYDKISFGNKSQRVFTDEGYLKAPAKIGRTGILQYSAHELGLTDKEPHETILIYRDEKEVFDADSMHSFTGKPVTNDHPKEMVNIENFKDLQAGFSGSITRRVDNELEIDLTITDSLLISQIKSGKVEISNGYTAEIVFEDGVTPDGTKYQGYQKNIKGNHIAFVDMGRAGKTCKLADGKPNKEANKNTNTGNKMEKIVFDGISIEVNDQAKTVFDKQTAEIAKLIDSVKNLTDSKASELATLQAELDVTKEKVLTDEAIDALVKDRSEKRVKLLADVAKIDKAFVCDNKSNTEIVKEVVSAKHDLTDKCEVYASACFDLMLKDADKKSDGSETVEVKIEKVEVVDSLEAFKKAQLERNKINTK